MRLGIALAALALLLGVNLALAGITARQFVDAQAERAAAVEQRRAADVQRAAADVQRRAIDAQRHAVEAQHAAVELIGQHMREMLEAARAKR